MIESQSLGNDVAARDQPLRLTAHAIGTAPVRQLYGVDPFVSRSRIVLFP